MNWNTTSLIVLVLVLVLCCGPMVFMMVKGDKKDSDTRKPDDANKNDEE